MPSRKRRRSVAFAPDDGDTTREVESTFDSALQANSVVWDVFCEEYHEVLEQLPLTLQRAFILIRELDDQAQSNSMTLVDCLRQYLQARADPGRVGGSISTDSSSPSSRGLISRVAAITEENSRAAQERVNIAQSACDSVERQIRLLDQSIEEVEAAITSASHPDSQPRRILSYAITGRWLRPQIEPPLQPSDSQSSIHDLQAVGLSLPNRSHGTTNTTSTRKTRRGKKRKGAHDQRMLQQPGTLMAGEVVVHEPDPNEPRYCYCNNVSYGAMVQCENPAKCPHDWFHYDCIGLRKAPKGKWFCPTCKPKVRGPSRKAQN